MRHTRTTLSSLLVILLGLALARTSAARSDTFKIIVHRDNPAQTVSRDFLRNAFLRKTTSWAHGTPLRPVDLAERTSVRESFIVDVLQKTPSQLRTYWAQRIFSGTGVPPPETPSIEAAIAFVRSHPGAVAYVPADALAPGTKVLLLE